MRLAVVTGTDLDSEISTNMELVEVASGGAVTIPEESWSTSRRRFLRDLLSNLSKKVRR